MRYCHRCDAQFEDDAEACLHCGSALEGAPLSAEDEAALLARVSNMVQVACLPPYEAPQLLDQLDEAGIHFTVLSDDAVRKSIGQGPTAQRNGIHIFVDPENLARASAVHQRMIVASLPDLPEGFDPTAPLDITACPACETPLDAAALRCEECGLEFPESER